MSAIRIEELPACAPGLNGWPYVEASEQLPLVMHGGAAWPRISVVTPSFNQGEFLERTIRSVLLQGYPQLEYIIIDGGSSDASPEIIKRYAPHLAYHTSEPDRGYIHAINKGFERATGEIICWLSSDDFYPPNTLRTVAENLARGTGNAAIVGHVLKIHQDNHPAQKLAGRYEGFNRLLKFWLGYEMHQPSIFWRREVFEELGGLDEQRDLIADFDYWVRIARRFSFKNVDQILACTTYHERAKTGDEYRRYHEALKKEAARYWGSQWKPSFWFLKASLMSHERLKPRLRPLVEACTYYYLATRHHLRARRESERKVV